MLERLNFSSLDLERKSLEMRRLILEAVLAAGEGHISSSLSCVDILSVLYFHVLNLDPISPKNPDRDRFILSKGHAGLALYAALALRGFFSSSELLRYGTSASMLGGHPDKNKVPGVEASTGSLGHGICLAVGMAYAAKLRLKTHRIFALVGDGECQEGSVWEAAMVAHLLQLDNLTVIVDNNRQQGLGAVAPAFLNPGMARKFEGFGWNACEVGGHDFEEMLERLTALPFQAGKPSIMVANTTKGKGISYMENVPIWHYRCPNAEEAALARKELEMFPNPATGTICDRGK